MRTKGFIKACIIIIGATIAFLSLTSCAEDAPAKMYWNASSQNEDNVDISFDVLKKPQIEIVVNSDGGECMLSCSNYRTLAFHGHTSRANVFEDMDCQYYAEITAPGIIRIRFDKMAAKSNEITSFFIIDGVYGENFSNTVVKVTRRLHNNEYLK